MDSIAYAKASSAYKLAKLVETGLTNKVNLGESSIIVPVGTTATRPTLGAGESAIRYNSDVGGLEEWTGVEWKNVSADITAVTLKGTDTEVNILSNVGMVAEDLWIASDTLDGWVYDGLVWINIGPLQGPQGIQGIPGKSAYTVAVEGGFVGTEAQWLLSLVGVGDTGNGIASIVKTGIVGLVDTYTVTMTSGATATFTVTNGLDGVDGLDVDHIAKTSGTGAAGTVDVYTVWGDVAETVNLGTFNVYNGLNGTGLVNSVVAGANVIVDSTDHTSPVVGLGASVTVQGNTFNGAEQLVKLGIDGKLPAIDGSNLTNMAGAVTSVAGKVGGVVLDTDDVAGLDTALANKQDVLVSGDTIKTINGGSILGSGNIVTPITTINNTLTSTSTTEALSANIGKTLQDTKQDTLVSGTSIKTVNGTTLLGSGDLSTIQTTITGNAGTATTLQTARTINDVSFDGSANITIVDSTKLPLTGGTMTGAITAIRETKVAMAANNIDLATGNLFTKTISGATTLTISNALASGNVNSFVLELTNGGSAVITWFSGVKWAGGIAPTLTTAGVDILGFYSHDGGTTWNILGINKDVK